MKNGTIHLPDAPKDSVAALSKALIQNCIPFIESKHRILTDKWYRAITGLSVGSFQASCIAFQNPQLFRSVGLFCGFLRQIDYSCEYEKTLYFTILFR